MAKRTMQTSTDVGGESHGITKPGTYHCQVLESCDGASTRGKAINGCSAKLSVLAGTEPDQAEKEFHLTLFDPDMSLDEEKQEWPKKKQTAYAIAINQVEPSKMGEPCDVDFDNAAGQQIFVTFGYGRKKVTDDKGKDSWVEDQSKVDLAYANIYHVDDPRAKDFPRNKEALALLPKESRKPAPYFDAIAGTVDGKKTSPAMKPKLNQAALADL